MPRTSHLRPTTRGPRAAPARALLGLCLGGILLGPAAPRAQTPAAWPRPAAALPVALERLDAADLAEQARVRAIVGDLGGPELPPVTADSPLDRFEFADRVLVQPGDAGQYADLGTANYQTFTIPAGPGGTGDQFPEILWYQTPAGYAPDGPPRPLVVAYHGFGNSANSVALQSTIDEECNARGWLYMAPTGVDDKLFGSPICQQHVETAIQWMLDNFTVDSERIYMVGFSMGGGVVSNFTAHHRDPDGIMLAALGVVSGSHDWIQTWTIGTSDTKMWLENEFNFGGPPSVFGYDYRRCSSLSFMNGSYPPLPGNLDTAQTMSINLAAVPTWVTWDLLDQTPEILPQQPAFVSLLSSIGTEVHSHPVIGTPVPHSWAVLDEPALFDFFATRTVVRRPADFTALLDGDGRVSWSGVVQRTAGQFSRLEGHAHPATRTLNLLGLKNDSQVDAVASDAGITGTALVRFVVTNTDTKFTVLRASGLADPPAYFAQPSNGQLVTNSTSEPAANAILHQLAANSTFDVNVVTSPVWTTDLTSFPDPVAPGASVSVAVDAPATSSLAFLLIGFTESLSFVKGVPLTVSLPPPTVTISFGLDANGDALLGGDLPNDPGLAGLQVRFQSISVGSHPGIDSVSNNWVMHVQ